MKTQTRHDSAGFTLVEVRVVTVIIITLVF